MHGKDSDLSAHLQAEHAEDLAPIAACMLRGNAPDAFLSIYNEAVAMKCRDQAPIAGPSLDRKAMKSFNEACEGHKVEALVCFVCACTYTYVEEIAGEGEGDIEWVHPFKPGPDEEKLLFLDRPIDETGDLLNLKTYLDRYDKLSEAGSRIQDHESFSDWSLRWPSNTLPVGRTILCCPEDPIMACRDVKNPSGTCISNSDKHVGALCRYLVCWRKLFYSRSTTVKWKAKSKLGFLLMDPCCQDRRCSLGHDADDQDLCEGCELPICSKCKSSLSGGALPALALANDMWTGYAPQYFIEQKVTVMEAICASPCVTTLVCMTMEARYEDNVRQEAQEAEPLNAKARMARHRFGARGNALTFPLPLEDLFMALQGLSKDAEEGQPLQLPRGGTELAHVARVLLKTNKEGATSEKDIKTLVHQAVVRREAGPVRRTQCHGVSSKEA